MPFRHSANDSPELVATLKSRYVSAVIHGRFKSIVLRSVSREMIKSELGFSRSRFSSAAEKRGVFSTYVHDEITIIIVITVTVCFFLK